MIGFMGTGKSTLGRRLAARLGTSFVDLDEEIERQAGTSIATIFAQAGEAAFRARELAALREVARRQPRPDIVAVGGGIVETAAAAPVLRQLGTIVWLVADPAICVARLGEAAAARPLLQTPGAWRARWQAREPQYRALADAVVRTGPEPIEASLERLLALAAGRPVP